VQCAACGRAVVPESSQQVDEQWLCRPCLHGAVEPIAFWPIGVVDNDRERTDAGFGATGSEVSRIRLAPGQRRFLAGIEDESHLTIVWHCHRARPIRTLFARGWDGKRVGPYASRTPDRPNAIAVTEVTLLEVRDEVLVVRGLDAIDGTPVLDIKVGMDSLRRGRDAG